MTSAFSIRPATPADVVHIHGMIMELAVFEKLEHLVVATEDKLHDALFGVSPSCEAVVGAGRRRSRLLRLVLPQFLDLLDQARAVSGRLVCAAKRAIICLLKKNPRSQRARG
jgi:hypothetical protein